MVLVAGCGAPPASSPNKVIRITGKQQWDSPKPNYVFVERLLPNGEWDPSGMYDVIWTEEPDALGYLHGEVSVGMTVGLTYRISYSGAKNREGTGLQYPEYAGDDSDGDVFTGTNEDGEEVDEIDLGAL
jgi:hypothetical protein